MKKLVLILAGALAIHPVFAQKEFKPSMSKAEKHLGKGELAEAKKHVDALSKDEKKSRSERVWYLYGKVYAALECSGKPSDKELIKGVDAVKLAVDAFNKVQSTKPTNSEYDKLIDFELPDMANPGTTIKAAKPTLRQCIYDKAGVFFEEKNYESALKEFRKAVLIEPSDTNGYVFMGYCAYQIQDIDAIGDASKGYYSNGGISLDLYNQQINILLQKEMYKEAEVVMDKVLEKDPNNLFILKAKYQIYEELDQIDKGIEVLMKIKEKIPNDDVNLFRIGYAYGEYKEDNINALKYYEMAIEANSSNFEANFNAAAIHIDQADEIRKEINRLTKTGELEKATKDQMLEDSNKLLKKSEVRMLKCYNIKPSDQNCDIVPN